MKKLFYLLFLQVFAFGCFSSNDKNRKDPPILQLSDTIKHYTIQKVGSYWVYSSNFNQLDTVTLIESQIRYRDGDGMTDYNGDVLEAKLSSTFFNTSFFILSDLSNPTVMSYRGKFAFFDEFWKTQQVPGCRYLGTISTVMTGDSIYYNIPHFEDERTGTKFYWKTGVGVIKIEEDTVTWNLIKYEIQE